MCNKQDSLLWLTLTNIQRKQEGTWAIHKLVYILTPDISLCKVVQVREGEWAS